jgi:hypothetical protein
MPDRLAVYPNPIRLARALLEASSPFVMVNLLRFKDRATGSHAGMSGRDAYMEYGSTVQTIQRPLGSRMIWAGEVEEVATGPGFDIILMLEYASPQNFMRFATDRRVDNRARRAGLEGQWLFAAATQMEAPSRGDLALVELGLETGADSPAGRSIWTGKVRTQVLGSSAHRVRSVAVRSFDDERARKSARDHSPASLVYTARTRPFEI